MGATSIFVSTFVSPLHLIVQTYFIISNAFQTKMWPSNLEKFRRVLVFDAEKVCVSERFSLIRRRKKKCSVVSTRNNTSNFPIPSNCAISCERDRTPIALSFLERFRISDPPAHSLTEQNSNLFLIPEGVRISDPPSWQRTKTAICS